MISQYQNAYEDTDFSLLNLNGLIIALHDMATENDQMIDLKAFRAALIRNGANGINIFMGNQKNPDGTSFKWFDVRSFPADPPLVVASSAPLV